jgi:hypothetical protein
MDIGQSIVDHRNLVLWVSELADDFPFYQLRIRDYMSCAAALEQGSLQLE